MESHQQADQQPASMEPAPPVVDGGCMQTNGNEKDSENGNNISGSNSASVTLSVTSRKRDHGAAELEVVEMATPTCSMCASDQIKYRCPRCERITCSLACCLAHKKQYACNGKRDLTKYIEIKKFTDADLASDYFFLEEVARSANNAHRTRNQLGGNTRRYGGGAPPNKKTKKRYLSTAQLAKNNSSIINPHVSNDWLTRFPMSAQLFVREAAKKGVAVTLLAPGMSKRTRSSCFVDMSKKLLFWRIEWEFPNAEVDVRLFEERASEDITLFSLLEKYLSPTIENVKIRAKLKPYAALKPWQEHVALLLRREFAQGKEEYFLLDGTMPLGSVLKRKAIVEFPIIKVVLSSQMDHFAIVHDVIEEVAIEDDQRHQQEGSNDIGIAKAPKHLEEDDQGVDPPHAGEEDDEDAIMESVDEQDQTQLQQQDPQARFEPKATVETSKDLLQLEQKQAPSRAKLIQQLLE